jgi:hypothetical protein
MIRHNRLSMDDVIVTTGGKRLHPQVVARFPMWRNRRFNWLKPQKFQITMYGLSYGKGKDFLFYRYGKAAVRVLRTVPCGNACCELHVRELGDEKHCCKTHWDSWLERMQEFSKGAAA